MSIKNRMKELSTAILAETKASQQGGAAVVDQAPEKSKQPGGTATAPGGMLAFRSQLQKHEETVRGLEAQLSQYQGSVRTVKLDADLIDVSKWANRHATSFESAAFEELKEEIAHAGGNVQPILVRPNGARYEVVFGHRRLAACKHLGIPVLAMVMALSDEELFTLMDRENRHREDLSPFEQGVMWARAIDEGLFSSARQLATHVGVSNVHVTQCMSIARLPQFVLDLFANPTEIQVRWAKAVNDQLQADPEALAERAAKIKALGKNFSASKVFEMLVSGERVAAEVHATPIKLKGKVVGKIQRGSDGEVSLSIKSGYLSEDAFAQLRQRVGELIGK